MKGLAEAEEQKGEGKDFKVREANYRDRKKRGWGRDQRWARDGEDIETGECKGEESETQ